MQGRGPAVTEPRGSSGDKSRHAEPGGHGDKSTEVDPGPLVGPKEGRGSDPKHRAHSQIQEAGE